MVTWNLQKNLLVSRESVPVYALAWIVLVLACIEYTLYMIGFLLIALLYSSIFLINSVVEKKPSAILYSLFYFSYFLSVLLAMISFKNYQYYRAIKIGNQTIECLNKYKQSSGQYPDSLSLLVPACLQKLPYYPIGLLHEYKFSYSKKENNFSLGFASDGFVICDYRTSRPKWRCRD
jgi:hypothetical protein